MKISVCMAAYNGERYIREQIDSILAQLSMNDELIISDDNSCDNTKKVVSEVHDPRIKLITNEGEKGYTRNFENALREATGEIIFFSDQDDVWVDNKVRIMLEHLRYSDMVVSNARIVDANLNIIHDSHFFVYHVKKGFWNNYLKTRYIGACMAFRREILSKALPFPKITKYCAYDYWLTIVSEAYYCVSLEEKPLLLYRRHDNNASSGGAYSKNSFLKKVAVRLYAVYNLVLLLFRRRISAS